MTSTLQVRVPDAAAGTRLDRFLGERAEIGSRAAAERLIASGAVRVDGAPAAKSRRLEGGETLDVELPAPESGALEPEDVDLRVVFEDEHLLVVDKPAGVVVHPAPGHAHGTLVHGLLARGAAGGDEVERPGIVHRLDRDTSGLLVVARSGEAHKRLRNLVRRREVDRTYLALVRGRPRSWQGRIEAPIGRDRTDPTRQSLDTERPREATTHFDVQELIGRHALLRVRLETGRTHQIRVHLAAIDLPVVGDPVYGVPEPELGRQFLHASNLVFTHPFTAARIDVASPLPPELGAHLARIRG